MYRCIICLSCARGGNARDNNNVLFWCKARRNKRAGQARPYTVQVKLLLSSFDFICAANKKTATHVDGS